MSSPKRQALSPPVSVKEEPRHDQTGFQNNRESPKPRNEDVNEQNGEEEGETHSPGIRQHAAEETTRLIPGKVPSNGREVLGLYPRFAAELDAVSSSRLRSVELLLKIFPTYSNSTLELILEGCRGNLVETIECILSTQEGQARSPHMPTLTKATPATFANGCSFSPPIITHASSFIHTPVPRNILARSATISHPLVCPPPRVYPTGRPMPPPLLVKPKFENPFAVSTKPLTSPRSRAPQYVLGLERNRGLNAFCTGCGHKMTVFDKFCANCGKSLNS